MKLWAFLVDEDDDGHWGVIGAILPGMGAVQLVTAHERSVPHMRVLAKSHARVSGKTVRFVTFNEVESEVL